MSQNKLQGTLPTTLGRLTELEVLSASDNQLSGSLHTELGQLTNLVFMSLSSNGLTGTLPSELRNLKALDFLSLQSNRLVGSIPDELSDLEELSTLWLSENDFVGSVPTGVCDATTSAAGLDISVDCDEVDCPCCSDCCYDCGADSDNGEEEIQIEGATVTENITSVTNDTSVVAPNNDSGEAPSVNETGANDFDNGTSSPENFTSSVPYPVDVHMETPNPPDYTCYDIQVGFGCYVKGWSIDFETIMCNQRDFNLITFFPSPNATEAGSGTATLQSPSLVGNQLPMDEALYWSTNCELQVCDGVVGDGSIYYRNQFPDKQSLDMVWPLSNGQYVMRIVQSDESGTATILAESATFSVADQC